jgi:LacI family transcriptional regulator
MLTKKAPRAIICCSDRIAFGAVRAAHDLGKRVPRDVAVVTIDGTIQTAYTRPSLTAVQIPWHRMFTLAAKLLLKMIESGTSLRQLGVRLRCKLVVRESTWGAAANLVPPVSRVGSPRCLRASPG